MNHLLTAGLVAALIGGSVLIYGVAASGEAHSTPVLVKGDRLDAKPRCSQASWPYYEAGCLRNLNSATRDVAAVRIVASDRR